MDITGDDPGAAIESYRRMLREGLEGMGSLPEDLPGFSMELVRSYLEHKEEIDGLIDSYADRWSLQRMPVVDRNLLRLGFTELLYREDIPANVTINEYLELAKTFSTGDSAKFINGVMGRLVRDWGDPEPLRPRGRVIRAEGGESLAPRPSGGGAEPGSRDESVQPP
jgi:N utilization substance protein B